VPLLVAAVLSTVLALYFGIGGVLVALRAQRHFSAAAWIMVILITVAAAVVAARSWRAVRRIRRSSN
jgi:uncharacterized membrane protein